jgi:antagonist of KipI
LTLTIEHPGAFTTIQDLGRPGFRAAGVPLGGAVDSLALRVANMLVGNDPGAAGLECALVGPRVRFADDAIVAICGAKPRELPHWQPFEVRGGTALSLADLSDGAYAYLAIAGGIDVPLVMNSRSTDTRVGWGGIEGRALRTGDSLHTGAARIAKARGEWSINFRSWYATDPAVRILPGREFDQFGRDWLTVSFQAGSRSDRMGVRLRGPALQRKCSEELASSSVLPGTIQVPPDGQPVVLLCDAQTIGGYPRIGHVIGVDHARVAQLRPGSSVRFSEVTIDAAHELWRARSRELAILRTGIQAKLRG